MVPSETALAIVPLDRTTVRRPSEKKAATGKERKLADASPKAENNAIQQKTIPSPRMKLVPNPPSGYNTSMQSSKGKSKATLLGLIKLIVSTPFSSKRFGGTSNA